MLKTFTLGLPFFLLGTSGLKLFEDFDTGEDSLVSPCVTARRWLDPDGWGWEPWGRTRNTQREIGCCGHGQDWLQAVDPTYLRGIGMKNSGSRSRSLLLTNQWRKEHPASSCPFSWVTPRWQDSIKFAGYKPRILEDPLIDICSCIIG